ncbi:MAG: hypothetical protein [Olavius algarvensis Gamma 1 endosymbiont]|nr:MAG: hypothetical protein [Olavius algarvensis Gamma 1 endosymbiont]
MLSTTGNSERADSAANQRQGRRKSIGNGRSGRVDFAPFALIRVCLCGKRFPNVSNDKNPVNPV